MNFECSTATTTKQVLIVEDDCDTATTIAEMLRDNGYNVSTAANREEASSMLQACPVDVILLDYMMPGQSASRFLYRVRSDYPNVRIILMTAANRVEDVARMLGIDEYIAKPILPDNLLEVLESPTV